MLNSSFAFTNLGCDGYYSDNQFGPAVSGCRRPLDFTLLFEETILSILPACILLLLAPVRLWHLFKASTKTTRSPVLAMKEVSQVPCQREIPLMLLKTSTAILMTLWLTLVILYARGTSTATPVSLPFAIVGFFASAAIFLLSYMEHKKSIKPSLLLNAFLLISVLFDIAHCRTLFLREVDTRIATVFAAALGAKVILLFLEARSKRSYLQTPYTGLPTESTIGMFNLGFFWWLNKTFLEGFRKLLSLGDLQKIGTNLESEKVEEKLRHGWDNRCE
jgi:ATP-binding cassette, subfamily C (CFTR/MRP), member 1